MNDDTYIIHSQVLWSLTVDSLNSENRLETRVLHIRICGSSQEFVPSHSLVACLSAGPKAHDVWAKLPTSVCSQTKSPRSTSVVFSALQNPTSVNKQFRKKEGGRRWIMEKLSWWQQNLACYLDKKRCYILKIIYLCRLPVCPPSCDEILLFIMHFHLCTARWYHDQLKAENRMQWQVYRKRVAS